MDSPGSESAVNAAALIAASRTINDPAIQAVSAAAGTLIEVAGRIIDTKQAGHRVFAFGAGHADMFAMELYSRAGGLRLVEVMHLQDLEPSKRPFADQMRDSEPERDPANGAALIDHYGIAAGDLLLIASHSGRNGAGVELALRCRDLGVNTVAVTSLAHSTAVVSRHPSGHRLFEIADVVIDTATPLGDAVLHDPRVPFAYAAASSMSFCLLAQTLNVALIATLLDRGLPVDVLPSGNV
jgi:uncharacterized phosphosugar-binding protein